MKVYFLLVFCLALIFNVKSQTLVDITTTSSPVSPPPGYTYSSTHTVICTNYTGPTGKAIGWSANLYLQSQMGPANILNSMTFMVDKVGSVANMDFVFSDLRIYLFHYGVNTEFTSFSRPDLVALNAVKVFEGDLTIKSPSSGDFCEAQVLFSQSFNYDGASSLGVYVERTVQYSGPATAFSPYWGFLDDSDNNKRRHLSDWYGSVADPLASTSIHYSSTGYNRRYAQIKFNDQPSIGCGGSAAVTAAPNASSNQSFCSSSNPKISDLVVTGSNIKWYNASSGGTLYSSPSTTALVNNTIYYASQTVAGVESTSRTAVTVTIVDPSISSSTNASQSFCSSTNPTVANLDATSSSGSFVKWYETNSSSTELLSTVALTNGTKYYAAAVATGSPACESLSRFEVTVTINTSPVASFLTSPSTSSCSSTDVVYTTETGMTDYTWSVPGTINVDYEITSGGIGSTDNTVTLKWLTSGDKTVTVGYKSGTCVTTTSATSTTNVVISPSISNTTSTSQSFCASPIPTVSNLSPASTPALDIKWYANLQGGSFLNDNTALVNGNKYYASAILTSSPACESIERYEVTVAINASLVASFVTSPATSSCSSTNVVYTTETGMTDYTWSVPGTINVDYEITSGGIGSTDNTVTLKWLTSGDKTVTVGYKSGTCVTTTSATSTTNVVISPSISNTTSTSQSFCASPIPTVSNLSPASTPALDIKWYANLQGGSFLNDNTALVNGNKYYASAILTSSPACESIERYEVTVTLNDPAKPTTTNTSQSFCLIEAKKVSDLSATGTNLTWYDAPTSGTAYSSSALLLSGTYYASQKVGTCESKNRLEVVVKISNPSNAPTGNYKQYFCMNSNPKVSDLDASGTTIKWYNSISGGVEFITTDALTDKTHYFATQTKNGECESVSRFDVFVNLSNVSLALDSQVKAHCGKSDGIITVIAKDGIGNYKYSWDNQVSNSNILTNAGIGQFVANVIDSVGCKSSLSIEELCESIVPQVITADGNGKNDTWVLNLEAKANLKIFNRWGSLVFTASPYMDDWNGQNNEGVTLGKGSLPSGTYFYTIDKKDGEKPLSGFIELVR